MQPGKVSEQAATRSKIDHRMTQIQATTKIRTDSIITNISRHHNNTLSNRKNSWNHLPTH